MKLVVGVSCAGEARFYSRNGADELYFGLESVPNHRAPGGSLSLERAAEVIRIAHENGAAAAAAANVLVEKNGRAVADLKELCSLGMDFIIIRDPSLMYAARRAGIAVPFVLSSLACCFNLETLDFYRQFGVSRLVFPHQFPAAGAGEMIRNPWGIETEVFSPFSILCANLDGSCFFPLHSECRLKYAVGGGGGYEMPRPPDAEIFGELYDCWKAGVQFLKISRQKDTRAKKERFFEAKRAVSLLKPGTGKSGFVKEMSRQFKNPLAVT